jgi:hypothetical protein
VLAPPVISVIIPQDGKGADWMTVARRALLVFIFTVVSVRPICAQQSKEVTTAEPAIIDVASLFKQADTVALVKIVSGDAENYSQAIYKAEVIKSFKGATSGEAIYFGPYVGEKLGWEYILFLRNVDKPIASKTTLSASYGTIHYANVFNEGYSSMETSYECVFGGKTAAEQCDHAARICTDYITLPTSIPKFPPITKDTPFGCRLVRKEAFISLLETFSNSKK